MAIKLKKDKNVDAVADEPTGGDFEPLGPGTFEVTIFDVYLREFKNGGNAGDEGYNIQFRISDGQKGANRRIFTSPPILLAGTWASGKDNFSLFNFLEAVQIPYVAETGVIDKKEGKPLTNSELRKMYKTLDGAIELPEPLELMAKPLVLVLGQPERQEGRPPRDRISSYRKAGTAEGAAVKNSATADLDDLEEL